MKLKRLLELKEKLNKESDLSKIWLFYMDHFADHPAFTDIGAPAKNEYLDAVIAKTCQQMFGPQKTLLSQYLLIHIPEYNFYHGPLSVNSGIGGIIYFEDIKKGMIAVSAPNDMVKYSRFSEAMRLTDPNDRN